MSLFDVVEYVNYKVGQENTDPDCKLAFTQGSYTSVAWEMCEVLATYNETPPDRVIVQQISSEIERRIDILNKQKEALELYVNEE